MTPLTSLSFMCTTFTISAIWLFAQHHPIGGVVCTTFVVLGMAISIASKER